MDMDVVLQDVLDELERAEAKFPSWPVDPIHAKTIIDEELGELSQAILEAVYQPISVDQLIHVEEEAIQVAAMALRFLKHMNKYEYIPSEQTSL